MLNFRIFIVLAIVTILSSCTPSDSVPTTTLDRCLAACDQTFASCRGAMVSSAEQAIATHGQFCVDVAGSLQCFTNFETSDAEPLLGKCRQGCQNQEEADERNAQTTAAYDECVENELSTSCRTAMATASEAARQAEDCSFGCQSSLGCEEWLADDFEKCEAECEALSTEADAAEVEKSEVCDAELEAAAKQCRSLSPEVTECSPGCSDSWLSNGSCEKACAVPECNYDEGDCGDPADVCAPGCMPAWLGDGQCQKECAIKDCDWDQDDCPNWDECPLNSGYPCACELSKSSCDDGTFCGKFRNGGNYGLCLKTCDDPGGASDCDMARWGYIPYARAACVMSLEGTDSFYCGIICRYYDLYTGPCPPGTHCDEQSVGDASQDIVGICEP